MLKQSLRTRHTPIFNFRMTRFAQRNQILQLICRFPVAIEFSVRLYMVNAQYPTFTFASFSSADRAFMSVSCFGGSTLFSPIWTAKYLSAAIISIASAASHNADSFTTTFLRAISTMALSRVLALVNAIRNAANFTYFCYAFSWNFPVFRLMCSKFRSALTRAKSTRSVVPDFERFTAQLANASLVFSRVALTRINSGRHSVFTSHCLPDVMSASGGKNRVSGATLADLLIVPQEAA